MQECKGHSQTVDHRRDKLEHQENVRVRGTYRLSHRRRDKLEHQENMREQGCKGHLQTVDGRGRDNLGH
jgi:hypothetical protein